MTATHDKMPTKRPTWSKQRGELRLDVWRRPWYRGDHNGGEYYDNRYIRFCVYAPDARVLASGVFHEWGWTFTSDEDMDIDWSLDSFYLNGTDLLSQSSANMGAAVLHGWKAAERESGESPLNYGTIAVFERLGISGATASQSVAIWQLIDDLIGREFRSYRGKRPRASVIVMKAFPLEYEGKVTKQNHMAFVRRQAAMMRHYHRRMGAKPFDGGEPGWMWIEINCPPKPKTPRRRRAKLRAMT